MEITPKLYQKSNLTMRMRLLFEFLAFYDKVNIFVQKGLLVFSKYIFFLKSRASENTSSLVNQPKIEIASKH